MTAQRQAGLRVWIDGEAIHDPTSWILSCAVEERADEASTFELMVDMSPIDGDWDVLEHGTFADENEVPNFALLNRVTFDCLEVRAQSLVTAYDGIQARLQTRNIQGAA